MKKRKDENWKQISSADTKRSKPVESTKYNFAANYNDHFETPLVAYKDITAILEHVCTQLHKTKEELVIYDPYYCQGNAVNRLKSLGYCKVINQNVDFYLTIEEKKIPDYDILITNPPYSGEHKIKLLEFLKQHHLPKFKNSSKVDAQQIIIKPFALLLPAYTATKSYWRNFAEKDSMIKSSFLYILPPDHYQYCHPEGTGKEVPPFYSAWFTGGLQEVDSVMLAVRKNPRSLNSLEVTTSIQKSSDSVASDPLNTALKDHVKHPGLPRKSLFCVRSIADMIKEGYVKGDKRSNPKLRKKMKFKLLQNK